MLWFGRNFSASAFGVSSVCIKIVRLACADGTACRAAGWLRGSTIGLYLLLEDEIGVAFGESEKCLAVVDVASLWHRVMVAVEVVGRGSAFERQRMAGLLDIPAVSQWC